MKLRVSFPNTLSTLSNIQSIRKTPITLSKIKAIADFDILNDLVELKTNDFINNGIEYEQIKIFNMPAFKELRADRKNVRFYNPTNNHLYEHKIISDGFLINMPYMDIDMDKNELQAIIMPINYIYEGLREPYMEYADTMQFALDYKDVNYDNSGNFVSIKDSSEKYNGTFSYYNTSRINKGTDGVMEWNPASDGYTTVSLDNIASDMFNNGMTVITMFKPKYSGYSHMTIGTDGHAWIYDNMFYGLSTNASPNSWMVYNRYPGTSDTLNSIVTESDFLNRYVVGVSTINLNTNIGNAYLYRKNGTTLERKYYLNGTMRGGILSKPILIGANHDNDWDLDSWRSKYGINGSIKYTFIFNEVFNQDKIEEFINKCLIKEF